MASTWSHLTPGEGYPPPSLSGDNRVIFEGLLCAQPSAGPKWSHLFLSFQSPELNVGLICGAMSQVPGALISSLRFLLVWVLFFIFN